MIPMFDGHCDTIMRCFEHPEAHISGTGGHWDLDRMHFGPSGQFFAFFWDSAANPDYRAMFDGMYTVFQRELDREKERVAFCRTGEEAQEAFRAEKLAAFLSVEGGELLGCDLGMLEEGWQKGVRAVNITWNHSNALSGSHCEEPERGLSPLGKDFVRRMQSLGMVVDVSHLSDPGFWDVMEVTEKPVMASHSNSRNVHFHTRNLTDEQITAIIQTGGVVGLNLCIPFVGNEPVTEDQLFAHIEHILDLGGEHALALGGDWDGIDQVPLGYGGVWGWEKLYESMLRRGYREELIRGIFFDNMMRVVSQVCIM